MNTTQNNNSSINNTITITVKYGTNNSLTRSFTTPITIGVILGDAAIQAALGFGSNVEGYLLGVPQPNSITLRDGDMLSINDSSKQEEKTSSKGH